MARVADGDNWQGRKGLLRLTVDADHVRGARRDSMSRVRGRPPVWNRYERAVLNLGLPPDVAFGIADASRRTRIESASASGIVPAMAGAVGPLFVAYVAWVLEQARAEGVSRLYFVARDGQVLKDIAEVLVGTDDGPELAYLYGSRQAWYLPSVGAVTRADLHFLLDGANSLSPADNLQKVHLTPDDIEPVLLQHGLPRETWTEQLVGNQVDNFWRTIFDPEVASLILDNSEKARDAALAYLDQEGLLNDDRWALVDVGWGLGAQASLRRILSFAGQDHTLGYYLAIGEARTSPFDYGRAEGFLVEGRDYGVRYPGRSTVFDDKSLIDQVFTVADHGRTLGYERAGDTIVPVLADEELGQDKRGLLVTVRSTVKSLARAYRDAGLTDGSVEEIGEAARHTMELFLERPKRAEVEAIGWFPVVYDHNDSKARTVALANRLRLRAMLRILRTVAIRVARGGRLSSGTKATPTALKKDLTWGFSWLAGSASLSSPFVRVAVSVFRRLNRRVSRVRVGRESSPRAEAAGRI